MNTVQGLLENLTKEGWSISAIARELGWGRVAVSRWRSGAQNPIPAKPVIRALEDLQRLTPRKRI